MYPYRRIAWMTVIGVIFVLIGWTGPSWVRAAAVSNSATGSLNGSGLDLTNASVNLNQVLVAGVPSATLSTVTVNPSVVLADGVSVSTITVTLLDGAGVPVSGKTVTVASDRGVTDTVTGPLLPTDAQGQTTATIISLTTGVANITAVDVTDGITLVSQPQVVFMAGKVLKLIKTADQTEATIGDAILYRIQIENTSAQAVTNVVIMDEASPGFKYYKGTARLDNQVLADPSGSQTRVFAIGTIGPNQKMLLSYRMIVGAGGRTEREYRNRATAREDFPGLVVNALGRKPLAVCQLCVLSNTSEVVIRLVNDPIFDLGTIIGKVFVDQNGNGYQDREERGVAGAMVALDDGTYALTDAGGRYHFPGVRPGQRMVKLNLGSLAPGARMTTAESRILSVTHGLLVKANFGIDLDGDTVSIGSPGVTGVEINTQPDTTPVNVIGSTETMTMIVNGQETRLPGAEVHLGVQDLIENVEIKGDSLTAPVLFHLDIGAGEAVKRWTLAVYDPSENIFYRIQKNGAPPKTLKWNGRGKGGKLLKSGEVYQYAVEVQYTDGSGGVSPRRLFGVNRIEAISLNLAGSAFAVGKADLSEAARGVLRQAAETLRKYPREKVVMEGHADSSGSEKINLGLSKARVQAAVDYLVKVEKIPADRFVVKWYGSSRPLISNDLIDGREINRRIEIKGQMKSLEKAKILDQLRSHPKVLIDGHPVTVEADGRFIADIPDNSSGTMKVVLQNERGEKVETVLRLPKLKILEPAGSIGLRYGEQGEGYRVADGPAVGGEKRAVVRYRIRGLTEPENTLNFNGGKIALQSDGSFDIPVDLFVGRNTFGFIVAGPNHVTRILNLNIVVSDHEPDGRLKMAVAPEPLLDVQLPPKGAVLSSDHLTLAGRTTAGNRVTVNGSAAEVDREGRFTAETVLPRGVKSTVRVEVTDPDGNKGIVEREVEVKKNDYFLLAFADGEVGQMRAKGYLAGAGMDRKKDYYSEGRLAYYFKGTVQGKYLVTSAFDTGKREFNEMFTSLDRKETDRLLTNLDPDKYYPVYGDSSAVVYDAQSQGRFYLAVDSEEFHLLVGDFAAGMNDTELAAYNRTLYGARAQYQSLSKTAYGSPETKVMVFGAEVRTANAHNQFRGTGGSLYYLNHPKVVEGSEQVRLEVRDKTSGVLMAAIPQSRNIDYQIRYEEGRIIFSKPISSVVEDGVGLVDIALLSGHPVYILVDFEYDSGLFEDGAFGGRVRQQIGDHLAVGGSYVKDEQGGAEYELNAGDVEIRLGQGTRLVGEVAASRGSGGEIQYSEDGGLSFAAVTAGTDPNGRAYKAAVETDVGEPWGWGGRLRLSGYLKEMSPGYFSNGTVLEQGTRKFGAGADIKVSARDTVQVRAEGERLIDGGNALSQAQIGGSQSDFETLRWIHEQGRVTLTSEYQARRLETAAVESRYKTGAAQLQYRFTDHLSGRVEQQNSFEGPSNVQSTVGVDYNRGRFGLFGRAVTGSLGESLRAGLNAGVGDNGLLTFSQQLTRDAEGRRSSQSVVHGENRVRPETRIYSEYQLNRGAADSDVSLAGLTHRWRLSEGLSIHFTAEGSRTDQEGQIITKDAFGAGLDYKDPRHVSLSNRQEIRHERGAVDKVQYLTGNALEYRLGEDLRLLGRANASLTQNRTTRNTEARFTELSAGMAYRPVSHDRFNGLAKYTLIWDQRPDLGGEEKNTGMSVWSGEGALELNRYLQWVEKLAFKIKNERIGLTPQVKTHTTLSIHRLNFHLDRSWDLGLEYRLLMVREAKDRQSGYLLEITRELADYLRLGAGYNFTRFTDNEFSDNNYSVEGWFFRFQGKY